MIESSQKDKNSLSVVSKPLELVIGAAIGLAISLPFTWLLGKEQFEGQLALFLFFIIVFMAFYGWAIHEFCKGYVPTKCC